MDETGQCSLKIMNLLQLGNLRSGHNLWREDTVFVITLVRCKEVTQGGGEHTYIDGSEGRIVISRDSLVKLHVKLDKRVSIEYHSALGVFILHLNKWFLH